jgi:ribosome-associated translation inhibitor RaiA
MQISTTFRDMTPSPALLATVERWAARLDHVADRILGCHVSIEKPHRHHLHGSPFAINVVLAVPGAQIAVSHDTDDDAYVAVANAFRTARRRLLDHVDLQRQFVKPPAGRRHDGFVASKS